MKKYYKSKRKYFTEYNNSNLLVYIGIRPKPLIIHLECNDIMPYYEEFVLNECKYNYTYRIKYTTFIKNYTDWCLIKYPDYKFTNEEKINIEAYINRRFLKDKINMPGNANVNGIWGLQMKSDENLKIGINGTHRTEIIKIDINTKTVIEEYKSLTMASKQLKMDPFTIRNCILSKKVIDNYVLQYKDDINIIEC